MSAETTAADPLAGKRSERAGKLEAERRRQGECLELRKAGYGYQAIADAKGYKGPSGAEYAVKQALARLSQPQAAALRQLENERLDSLQRAVWSAAIKGDGEAIDRVLRIMKRRAELNGLDAPLQVDFRRYLIDQAPEIAHELGLTEGEAVAAVEEYLRSKRA